MIRRQMALGRPRQWREGESLPLGYAALTFIEPRRRRASLMAWIIAAGLTLAAIGGVLALILERL